MTSLKDIIKAGMIALPLVVGGCNSELKEPVKADYDDSRVEYNNSYFIEDINRDGVADAIVAKDMPDIARFYAEEYKERFKASHNGVIMPPEMRKSATDFLKAYNELNYQAAKAEYDKQKLGDN